MLSGRSSRTRSRWACAIITSVPSGRCGPCCSVAASGNTAIHRAGSAPAKSGQWIPVQSRGGRRAAIERMSLCADLQVGLYSCERTETSVRKLPIMGQNDRRSPIMKPALLLRALTMGLAAMVAAISPAGAQTAPDKVSFGTNWVPEAEHGGFFQALADGTYKKYGLDVTIVPGGPNDNNRMLLIAGKIDFFMAANTLMSLDAVVNKVPVVTVAAIFQKDPQVLLTHPESNVTKLEELKPLTLFVSKEGISSYFQWLKSEYGFSEEKVKPYTFNPQPFIVDKQSAMQGYVTSEPFAIEKAAKFKPGIILLADYGFNTYSTLIETRRELIDKKPDLVQRFVDASIIGWYNYLYGNNAPANAMIKNLNPEMTDELLAYSVAKMKEYGIVDSGDAVYDGIGAMTDARVASFFDKMVRAGVVRRDIDFRKSYTLRFANKGVGLDLRPKN